MKSLTAKIILCIIIAEVLGGIGGYITASSVNTWYADLIKPVGNPPNWLFGPAWSIIYAMIGTTFALLWHNGTFKNPRTKSANRALTLFIIQAILNLAWTPVFFGLHLPGPALIIILLLAFTILLTIIEFKKHHHLAAILLLPYLIWVTYASYLNASIWLQN